MSKYSEEFKLEVIKYCIDERNGVLPTARYFNVDVKQVKVWCRKYKQHGINGLTKNKMKYDGKFKIYVVEYMHSNHLSLTETAIYFNLGNHHTVSKWERIYCEEGPQLRMENEYLKKLNALVQERIKRENKKK